MAFMFGDEKGYDRLGETGNLDFYQFFKRCTDEDEKKCRARFEKEDPQMYYEFLEWEKEWEKELAEYKKEESD